MIGGKSRKAKKVYGVLDGVTRKIKKSYDVVGGKTRQFFSAEAFGSYSGAYTTSSVKINGVAHTLYTLTGSGTLVLQDSAKVWMCGGGSGGSKASNYSHSNGYSYKQGGGGGAGGYVANNEIAGGTYVITVGSGGGSSATGGVTSITSGDAEVLKASGGKSAYSYDGKLYKGCNGGTGGGAGGSSVANWPGGTGAGVSTYPFGLTSLKAHCGGGGGGAFMDISYTKCNGAAGGTNGGNGSDSAYGTVKAQHSSASGGAGGAYGGGTGGLAGAGHSSDNNYIYDGEVGGDATFYGSGGGGGSATSLSDTKLYAGGTGYQGVVYIAVPA